MTKRFALMLTMVAIGVVIGRIAGHVTHFLDGPSYSFSVTALLTVGLYSSTHAIDIRYLRSDVCTVVMAVTVGVLFKAALVTGVMLAVFRNPLFLVLGIAVAQIDPLSVAALGESSLLSRRGRSLLLAWASFDDPVTTLLTVYVATLAMPFRHGGTTAHLGLGGPSVFAIDLLGSLGMAVAAILLYRLARTYVPQLAFLAACALLLVVFALGVWRTWVLAVALVGLMIRPVVPGRPLAVGRLLGRLADVAFLVAAVLLGVVLSLGVSLGAGIVLGVAAYVAHGLVSLLLTRLQTVSDKVLLALAQQNGITAIILALLLEPLFGGTIAIVAPAILTVNLLYLASNSLYVRWNPWRVGPERHAASATGEPVSAAGPAETGGLAELVSEVGQQRVHVGLGKPASHRLSDHGIP
jgi:hypothetical protein